MNRFESLNAIDVSEKVEKKGALSYLSWPWAWSELKKKYPDSYYTIYEATNGCFYHTDGKTCWVKTGVTLVDGEFQLEHVEYLPILDTRNRSIPLNQIDSYAVNKAIQRGITKAIARHGLGLYVYAGEDLPEDKQPQQTDAQPAPPPASAPPPVICVSCHKPIEAVRSQNKSMTAQAVTEFTVRNAGKAMCLKCYNKWKKEKG